jgi:NADPH:quinone reductase-like Zn-dependent oxidoreductase
MEDGISDRRLYQMRAVVLRTLGTPEVLHVEDVPDPRPDAGEALARLRAAALNHRDVWIQSTLSPASAGLGQAALPRRYVKVARMAIADN